MIIVDLYLPRDPEAASDDTLPLEKSIRFIMDLRVIIPFELSRPERGSESIANAQDSGLPLLVHEREAEKGAEGGSEDGARVRARAQMVLLRLQVHLWRCGLKYEGADVRVEGGERGAGRVRAGVAQLVEERAGGRWRAARAASTHRSRFQHLVKGERGVELGTTASVPPLAGHSVLVLNKGARGCSFPPVDESRQASARLMCADRIHRGRLEAESNLAPSTPSRHDPGRRWREKEEP
jgi:hypothetical protein